MATESLGLGRYQVVCDDPYRRGCRTKTGSRFGQDRSISLAEDEGWQLSRTGKIACPNCLELHETVVEKKVRNGSLRVEESYIYDDPFDAVFLAMIFDGDPLVAGLVSGMTGSTSLGVIAGILAGDNNEQTPEGFGGGGDFGGAGAGGQVMEEQYTEPPTWVPAEPDTLQDLPVIAEPDERPTVWDAPTYSEGDAHQTAEEVHSDTTSGTAY